MKNVKPKARHVWMCIADNVFRAAIGQAAWVDNINNGYVFYNRTNIELNEFIKLFKFVPQNHLERLAVNVNNIGANVNFLTKRGDGHSVWQYMPGISEVYTRQQWQNMRYELGISLIAGTIMCMSLFLSALMSTALMALVVFTLLVSMVSLAVLF